MISYLVPKLDVTYEDVQAAMAELGAVDHEPDEGDFEAWALGGATIHYFEDPGLHIDQIAVEADDAGSDDAAEVVGGLRQRLAVFEPADMPGLFADVADDEDALVEAINILAAVAPPAATDELVALFERGLHDEDSIVRERAALAASVPAWPELRPLVQRLADEDDDDDVRETARVALERFE